MRAKFIFESLEDGKGELIKRYPHIKFNLTETRM